MATDEGEEGRTAIGLKIPQKVSKTEREEHELTHTPFRAWCRHCVRGRGKNMAHKSSTEDKSMAGVPRVSMDYFFMSSKDEKASENPLIVMTDEGTGEKYARAVGQKGLGAEGEMDWLIKDLSTELKVWGHPGGDGSSLILKCDAENAIVVVRDAVAKYHGGRVVPEGPAKNESQSNGKVEEAGKTVREFTRVLKEQLEHEAEMTIKPGDVITLWMVRWAAMLVSRYMVGKDGLTAYERRRGRKCKVPVAKFAEKVWYKKMRDSKERKDKFESEWEEGIWLGHGRASNEVLIGTLNGVVRAFTVQRKPEDERWSPTDIQNLRGTPQQPDPTRPGSHIPIRVKFDEAAEGEEVLKTEVPRKENGRRMAINTSIMKKYGYTDGCEGCRFHRAGMQDPNARKPHSEKCRTRMREEMMKDEEDKEKIDKDDERLNRKIAEKIEKSDDKEVEKEEPSQEKLEDERPKKKSRQGVKEAGEDEDFEVVNKWQEQVRKEQADREADTGGAKSSRSGGVQEEGSAKRRKKAKEGSNEAVEDKDDEGDTDMIKQIKRIRQSDEIGEEWNAMNGEIIDLTACNFSRKPVRQKVSEAINERKPKLIIGSPMRADHCKREERKAHLKFIAEIYKRQVDEGFWFLHDKGSEMDAINIAELRKVCEEPGVRQGKAKDNNVAVMEIGRGKRSLQFITNSEEIEDHMTKGSQKTNQAKVGKMREGKYSIKVCEAIYEGLKREVDLKNRGLKKIITTSKLTAVQRTDMCDKVNEWHDNEDSGQAYDDVSGEWLCSKEVMKARMKEIEYIQKKKVYRKIPRRVAIANGWKIIKTRWIDLNKGDRKNPNYRSRFVGKEFNDGVDSTMFAATPPLEALKLLISEAGTVKEGDGNDGKVIMINDVARAYFEAPVRRKICIELPEEDLTAKDRANDMVGLLEQSLYGTRDAASNFQAEVQKLMTSIGFKTGKYNVSTYHHPGKRLKTLVHGDDFVTTGGRENIQWLKKELEKRFEIKTTMMGLGPNEVREARLLNRIIELDETGWRYEADPRHAELIIKQLNLTEAKGVKTPGEDLKPWSEKEDAEPLCARDGTSYRAIAARANYLSPDRADAQYAIKEICRGMSSPTKGDLKKLRRLARYFIERPRLVMHFPFQLDDGIMKGYSDSDWAGCRRTAKSTSGGCMMRGGHCVKSWSTTQKSVTLSSAEAELVAAVKMSAELIGIEQLMSDWGTTIRSEVLIDSSAALGIVSRKGNGKLRHIKVGMLWIQEKQENEELTYKKVHGVQNPADLMTKNLTQGTIDSHLGRINASITEGRALIAPEI